MNPKRDIRKDLGLAPGPDAGPAIARAETVRREVLGRIAPAFPERKELTMKPVRSIRKTILIAAAAALVMSLGALAASGVIARWDSDSLSAPDYTSLPAAEQCEADAGYAPVLLERFENGYAFREGSVVTNTLYDENDGVQETFKSFDFRYEKDGDRVYLSQEKYTADTGVPGEVIAEADGAAIYYFRYNSRSVAPDYVLTPEEEAAQAAGELVFSYGVDIPGVEAVQSVSWTVGDMHYSLMQIDGALTAGELADMAAELLRAE